ALNQNSQDRHNPPQRSPQERREQSRLVLPLRPLRLDSLYQCCVVCFRIGCLGGIISGVINIESKQAIESLCPEVGEEIIQDFFARMDDDYFATFSPEEISTHIRMSCALDQERPAQCRITPRGEDEFDIIIVGLDYLSEFSIFCGLL